MRRKTSSASGTLHAPVAAIDPAQDGESRSARTVRELHELVAALDRRVPQVERVGEVSIARAAAALRAAALQRIEELQGGVPGVGPPRGDE